MKVVALVSGGKDSCYNMLQCVMAGHDIVALANLKPESKDELDSYMYQTVGHQGVELYAEAMNIPLFRQPTQGVAILNDKLYTPTPEDEVEDLYQLLLNIKSKIDIEAVSVGAVLSDYQRLRVENVCQRLGLVALAYLWRRDQAELLQEMIDYKIKAIIIKVAALGLDPRKHLGLTISEIQPYLIEMNEKYGLNICGEGGEYETFTLDCPLFSKSILINDCETVIDSNDNIAPVGYLSFRHLSLVEKLTEENIEDTPLLQRLQEFPIKTAEDYISDIDAVEELEQEQEQSEMESGDKADHSPTNHVCLMNDEVDVKEEEVWNAGEGTIVQSDTGWCWLGGISDFSSDEDIVLGTSKAMCRLKELLETKGLGQKDLVRVVVYLSSLDDYVKVNRIYSKELGGGVNPPVRVCVGTPLSSSSPVRITALAYPHAKHTMHVQSLSHWAPANIGPYSQAIKAGESGEIVYVAGQIGLVPGSMELVAGGVRRQCKLALRHIGRLIKSMDREFTLGHVVQGVCYVTRSSYIKEVTQEWEKRTKNAIVDFVVVKELPRQADVEFQIWAHLGNNRFQYEETGCMLGSLKASLRRRWNYDNTVSAVVCCVARACSGRSYSECGEKCEPLSAPEGIDEVGEVSQVLVYALQRLTGLQEEGTPLPVCSLQIYYALGRCRPETLQQASNSLSDKFLCATTLIPVISLNHPSTFLSICSVRH